VGHNLQLQVPRLIGISAGTTVRAVVAANNKTQEIINQTSTLMEEEKKLQNIGTVVYLFCLDAIINA